VTECDRVRDYHAAQCRIWIRFAVQAGRPPGATASHAAHLDAQAAHHARQAATWQRYQEPTPCPADDAQQ